MAQKLEIFRRRYGGSPLHLVGMVASLALAGFAGLTLTQALGTSKTMAVAVWLIGAAVTHDLILFPIYTLLDKAGTKLVARPLRPSTINFIRLPVLLSGLLFLVYVPLVGGYSGTTYESITGLPVSVYFGRWLLLTGAMFGVSGALYAVKLGLSGSRGDPSQGSSS